MIGKRLAYLRKQKNLSMQEIANRLGIAKSTYAGYESDYRQPSLEVINKIADFFDVSTDYLLGRTNVPSQFETEAAHRTDDPMDDLPQQAREDIEKFKEFIRQKYGIE
ncbi:helix-turn-helix domain-containing protein [Kroppenstedtia eburnea]|uniref:Transcriptional regulator, contains XRE-family HTH domain n=1 Tax=Kroppenstedtia eburnea TaxID=714067 RepID=A0A1N7JGN1_9BACL|nr:helix-turn-helix transcriptional regulator [Kroppenstedtia eburnea]QKI80557.1 helix-turn-helix transcriptional regulator [Kroppenstedtia eburnea]SIS48469.1 Transcriptional regulator, contains XRE-family HTH domain [Kroppenstedtia eburnea]